MRLGFDFPDVISYFSRANVRFLTGASVRPFVLGLRGPRFPASSDKHARSAPRGWGGLLSACHARLCVCVSREAASVGGGRAAEDGLTPT